MQQYIFTPSHLNQSLIPNSVDVPPSVQHVFSRDRGVFEDTTYFNPSWAINSGTIVTTIGDVAVTQFATGRRIRVAFTHVTTGSGVAVVLNPRDRTVTLFREGSEPVVVRDADRIPTGEEMPGFTLDARAVFDASQIDENA